MLPSRHNSTRTMAPFNKRQIGYIQAVAGRQQHVTLISGRDEGQLSSFAPISEQQKPQNLRKVITGGATGLTSSDDDAKSLLLYTWNLDTASRSFDSRAVHNNGNLDAADFTNLSASDVGMGNHNFLRAFRSKCADHDYSANFMGSLNQPTDREDYALHERGVGSYERASADGYLRSTTVTFRFTLPNKTQPVAWENVKDNFNHPITLHSSVDVDDTDTNVNHDELQLVIPDNAQSREWWKRVFYSVIDNTFDANSIPLLDNINGNSHAWNNATVTQRQNLANELKKQMVDEISHMKQLKPMGQDHYEFRWIVWRPKLPTCEWSATVLDDGEPGNQGTNLDQVRDGCSFRHPGYDLFMSQTGRKRGFVGYTHNPNLDKWQERYKQLTPAESYSGPWYSFNAGGWILNNDADDSNEDPSLQARNPYGEADLTVDDLLTARLNRDDYVVMKDVRFFLGKEHGKSHFEDTLHWDWNEPIDTANQDVLTSPTLNNKNFKWNMTLIGTTNGKSPVMLNKSVRWTTKMESG